jgi:hypothetical protein
LVVATSDLVEKPGMDLPLEEVGAGLRRVASAQVTGAVKHNYSRRSRSDLSQTRPFSATHDLAYVAAQRFDILPALRQFYVAA